MSELLSKSRLGTSSATFDQLMNAFGVVTVMNARVYNKPIEDLMVQYEYENDFAIASEDYKGAVVKIVKTDDSEGYRVATDDDDASDVIIAQANIKGEPIKIQVVKKDEEGNPITTDKLTDLDKLKAHEIVEKLLKIAEYKEDGENEEFYVKMDTLKITNINMEGPSKTVTGGQTGSALIKYGKTATIEIQDALGNADVLELLGGAIVETYQTGITDGNTKVLHFGDQFSGPKPILGESFFIDQKTGAQVKVYILIYEIIPDSIFNLTQDAEGDATVFDLNGSLNSKAIVIGTDGTQDGDVTANMFYSILPQLKY